MEHMSANSEDYPPGSLQSSLAVVERKPLLHCTAIFTKYIGPSNTKGPRISVRAGSHRMVVSYDYALNVENNHRAAAESLCNRLGWLERGAFLAQGSTNDGAVFVIMTPVR